jgi:hypothetical protein
MAATLKLLPTEPSLGEAVRGWNLTDLLRRVAADDRGPPDEELAQVGADARVEAPKLRDPSARAKSPEPRAPQSAAEEGETWTEALDLAVEATDAIRFADEHIARLEADNRELESYLEREIRALQARMRAADEIVQRAEAARQAAEARAERAEQRAETAETCLARIRDQLSPIRRNRVGKATGA